mgnify:CR=1 FL=1
MSKRNALITGGARGIGAACAKALKAKAPINALSLSEKFLNFVPACWQALVTEVVARYCKTWKPFVATILSPGLKVWGSLKKSKE